MEKVCQEELVVDVRRGGKQLPLELEEDGGAGHRLHLVMESEANHTVLSADCLCSVLLPERRPVSLPERRQEGKGWEEAKGKGETLNSGMEMRAVAWAEGLRQRQKAQYGGQLLTRWGELTLRRACETEEESRDGTGGGGVMRRWWSEQFFQAEIDDPWIFQTRAQARAAVQGMKDTPRVGGKHA
eukprot:TRINITY_DN6375_c1_g4_i2.p1 TRINITY_DN6375_c1_g4~~TRINITY_DN6375_c1_g4_i2.p1  ORF type:complete len:185 (+),score=23.97 TRINITY_DN6375_c1_g4_i2:170-724(+)